MDRPQILALVRELAAERGGHIGQRAFFIASGIPQNRVLGKHWATWNDLLSDAGIEHKSFLRPASDVAGVAAKIAKLVSQLRRWPTENQLRLARATDSSFPSLKVVRQLRKKGSLLPAINEACSASAAYADARPIIAALVKAESKRPEEPGRSSIAGYVYLMRSGRRYKIGHTTSPSRRHREVRLDLPDPTLLVHSIATDDPPGIESYWHRRFAAKRVRETEFFELEGVDVLAFKRRRYQ